MDHGTMAMSATTTGGMTMATGSSHSSSMDDMMVMAGGQMFMDMKSMAMTFFSAESTPLYSLSWTPTTLGQYVGTCFFLIFLAVVFRFLLALRFNLTHVVSSYVRRHDTDILRSNSDDTPRKGPATRPWRVNDAVIWASIDTTIAGVSYLMMIAVMTMNVGYFLSILGGTFLGSFVVGRWTGTSGH